MKRKHVAALHTPMQSTVPSPAARSSASPGSGTRRREHDKAPRSDIVAWLGLGLAESLSASSILTHRTVCLGL